MHGVHQVIYDNDQLGKSLSALRIFDQRDDNVFHIYVFFLLSFYFHLNRGLMDKQRSDLVPEIAAQHEKAGHKH